MVGHAGWMRELSGAVVVVVGATGGLGSAIAADLETRGATVIRAGRSGTDLTIDIRDSHAGDAVVRVALGGHGHLDGVIVASGEVAFGALADTDPAIVEELFLVNAMGPLWLAQRVVEPLIASKGFFAAITGIVAERIYPGLVAYGASKAALSSGLAGLRAEVGKRGVQVLDARPPHTETGLATRPLSGRAPKMPVGLDPAAVAKRIVDAIVVGDAEIPAAAFG